MLRVHATNLKGLGSQRLVESLLPVLLDLVGGEAIVYLGQGSQLAQVSSDKGAQVVEIKRYLFNSLSRFLEVTFLARRFRGPGGILVLGDLPLWGISSQTVLVHSPFIIDTTGVVSFLSWLKVLLLQIIFLLNHRFVDNFIVQTESMKVGLVRKYGISDSIIYIIPQPPPEVIRRVSDGINKSRLPRATGRLNLFYPARFYPHKNHMALSRNTLDLLSGSVSKIVLTVDPNKVSFSDHVLIECIGEVGLERISEEYMVTDALLFLSRAESYGLPLLEALWLDLPIVCPDLPYARDILGCNKYFFDIRNIQSLVDSIDSLRDDLSHRRGADWSDRRRYFPKNWRDVGKKFLDVVG